MLPEDATPPEWISEDRLDAIAADVAARLFHAYAGELSLEDVFTPVALTQAAANDSLIAGIAKGDRRVVVEHDVIGWMEHHTRYLPDSTPVRVQLEITVDIAPDATTTDGSGNVLSTVGVAQRRNLEMVVAWDGLNERWQIDELRSDALGSELELPTGTPESAPVCPWEPEEIPAADGFDRRVRRAWCDGLGRELPRSHLSFIPVAPAHCEWQSAALLHLGVQPGWEIDPYGHHQFGRDPRGVFVELWQQEYAVLDALPDGAVDTGLTNGNVRLFFVPGEYAEAVYAVMGDVVERWPRLDPPAACL